MDQVFAPTGRTRQGQQSFTNYSDTPRRIVCLKINRSNEVAVDRRAETIVTQQQGYAATEQVTRDVAAEGRLRFLQIDRIMYTLLGILEILLGLTLPAEVDCGQPRQRFHCIHLWCYRFVHGPLQRINWNTYIRGFELRSDDPGGYGGLCAVFLGPRARGPGRDQPDHGAHRHPLNAGRHPYGFSKINSSFSYS